MYSCQISYNLLLVLIIGIFILSFLMSGESKKKNLLSTLILYLIATYAIFIDFSETIKRQLISENRSEPKSEIYDRELKSFIKGFN